MATHSVLALYSNAEYAAEAGEALDNAGFSKEDYEFLTDTPYPEGALGERAKPQDQLDQGWGSPDRRARARRSS